MTRITIISNPSASIVFGKRIESLKLARQAARNVIDDYAFEDSDEEHYTDDDT